MSTHSGLVVGAVGLALVASGCVDPRGRFDEFADKVPTIDADTTDRPESAIFDITGDFLLAINPVFADGSYVQFLVAWTLTPSGNTATLDGSYQPLRVISTMPDRNPVGQPMVANGVAVDSTASFTANVSGTLPGPANPVSGTTQSFDGYVHGTIKSTDLVCGTLTGTVGGAIVLDGSTFAAIRVTDTTPENLPPPVVRCPETNVDAGVDAAIDAAIDGSPDAMDAGVN